MSEQCNADGFSMGGKWCRILPLANGQINLNGNLEYRRIEDGDGS